MGVTVAVGVEVGNGVKVDVGVGVTEGESQFPTNVVMELAAKLKVKLDPFTAISDPLAKFCVAEVVYGITVPGEKPFNV